jgi:hypothetical protein
MPQELRQSSRQKLLAEDSLSCSEITGDYTLDAIRRSTESSSMGHIVHCRFQSTLAFEGKDLGQAPN